MKVKQSVLKIAILFCFALPGCQKPSDDGESSGGTNPSSGRPIENNAEVTTDCGVVMDGDLHNPIERSDGEIVRVDEVLGNNLVVIQGTGPNAGGPRLLKLHGLGAGPKDRSQAAMNMIESLSSGTAFYYQAAKDCTTTLEGGGQGTIGQLISRDGKSFSESLVKSGLADVDSADACGGDKIAACLSALKGTGIESKGEMRDFLWKPVSEKDGKLIIHELHCNATALVNGTPLTYYGSGNGRCGTYRSSKPGCAYGANIKVEVIDKATGRPYSHNGQPFVMIPNGCNRLEFK